MLSALLSWLFAVTFAFFTNKIFVFRSSGWNARKTAKEALMFFSSRAMTGAFDIAFMFVTVDIAALNPTLMKIVSNLFAGIMNYIAGKLIIFRKK